MQVVTPTPPQSKCKTIIVPDKSVARLPMVVQSTAPEGNTVPAPRVVGTEDHNGGQPHIIPDDSDTYPIISQLSNRKNSGPHVILDVDEYDATQRYIHKYNTRSAPRYLYAAAAIQAQQFQHKVNSVVHQANHVLHPVTGKPSTYKRLAANEVPGQAGATWIKGLANEFGRLADGVGTRMPTGTNTIKFIPKTAVPYGRTVTYGNMVCDIRPQKAETHRVRMTVGGDKVDYPGNVSTPTSDLTTAKCLINSILSTPNAKGLCIDIKDFYLNTDVERFEYMKVKLDIIPQEIIEHYDLTKIAWDRWVYIEIQKGMYGLPQAGISANNKLKAYLATVGYHPTKFTPGLWTHKSRDITFALTVDDFFIKYTNVQDAEHLLTALKA